MQRDMLDDNETLRRCIQCISFGPNMLFGIRGEVLLGTQTEGRAPPQTRFGLLFPLKIGNDVAALVAVLSPRGAADAEVVQGGVVLMERKRRERG